MSQPQTAEFCDKKLTVFYDGACPLCEREIGFYRQRKGAGDVHWVDVSTAGGDEVAPGLSRSQAMARFHVRDEAGRLVDGGEAFAMLWRALPGFRVLGRICQLPPIPGILNWSYDRFLKVRPRIQAWAGARQADDAGEALPPWLLRDLRSDHAGETGAVAIYQGILAVSRDAAVRAFAEEHLATERRHLTLIEGVLATRHRSLCLPLWRLAGFLTGALPALFGARAVFATIEAVETFVDRHYAEQLERLSTEESHQTLHDLLALCRDDEIRHRDDARGRLQRSPGVILRLWCWMVGFGSAAAVALARRI